jgi:DNA polymerase (family X)
MENARRVAQALEEMATLLRLSAQPKFKVRAYENAARVVELLGDELGDRVARDDLRRLPGIGPALSKQIEELWRTGSSEYWMRLRAEYPQGAAELARVPGMTARRIRAAHEALGVRSVEDLRDACIAERVRAIRGFGERTEQRLLAGCERALVGVERQTQPMLRAYALDVAAVIERELSSSVERTAVAGPLRRGEELLSELDFVVVGELDAALQRLSQLRQVVRVDRELGMAQLGTGIRAVLHAAPGMDAFGSTLFVHTGSAAHVARVCERASGRGFAIAGAPEAERSGLPVRSFESEEALYGALGLSWVPPERRGGAGEVELAEQGSFADLIRAADIQGLVHCHTQWSDGKNSILEMARAAHALGMKYITITDHSPSAHYARGVTLDRLAQQWDEIAAAQEEVPIRILRGTESDILSDGSLDYPDAVLEQFDVIIASIHARHRLDREAMTARIVRALSLPLFKIWGHALGRILNHRPALDCDMPRVLDALASAPGAIEINADPHRLDLPAAWIPAARERGIPFVVSVDAHSTASLGILRFGIEQARRGGLLRREVLNARGCDEFVALVKPVPMFSPRRSGPNPSTSSPTSDEP